MSRPARICINLNSLRNNLSRVRTLAPDSQIMAIIKADGYGHGIERVARALGEADAFGVACLEEATAVREAGITKSIVLLEGPYSGEELYRIESMGIDIVVHEQNQIDMLEKSGIHGPLRVWLKLDTGMHRLGIRPENVNEYIDRLQACACIADKIHLMTHLACANEKQHAMTRQQLQLFEHSTQSYRLPKSIANSAAVLSLPQSHVDWVRPGIMLYGISPFAGESGESHGLKPVMSFQSELIAVKPLTRGDSVGYGASWRCPEDMRVGIVAAGYGDGYPRHAPAGTQVLVNGTRTGLVGHASMDMLAVDLRAVPQAKTGDPVVLWGEGLPVEEVATSAGTIPYELVSSVQKRLQFVEHGES